ncbi:MAG TPA: VWA domain-containing protein [Bryobacteraceae bacterium]
MNRRAPLIALLSMSLVLNAQQTGTNAVKPDEGAPTFKSSSQLVVETVNVKDKDGKPVEGLTAKDFVVTENGIAQTISFLEYQKLEDQPAAPMTAKIAPAPRLAHSAIAPERPGDIHYKDRRLIALYFDLSSMPVEDQIRAFTAAEKFVRTQMTPVDLVAVMLYTTGSVQILQDFTTDREKILTQLQTLIVGEDEDAPQDTSDKGAAFGQDDSEFNIFYTDRQLAALQTATQMLGTLNEKKTMVYFASGLRLNGTNNMAQLHATINSALRAGVALYPVDARGLIAMAPMGDATTGSPGGSQMYSGGGAIAMANNFRRSQDTMWTLGADTGGKALLDFNDLTRGIVEAQKAFSSYYILGYYTNNSTLDGKFRRIKITLNNGLTASLDFRQGYYAGKVFKKFTTADKERQLEEALMLEDPVTELTIAMEIDYFQLNRAEYFVPVSVKIPGSELALARKGGADHTLIDFVGEIKDDYGTTISNVRDHVDIKLTGTTAAELSKRPIEYDTGFTLLPGKYKLKFLARDAETGRIGTYEGHFTIPNLNKEDKRVPLSSVILSSQRVELKEALFNATTGDKQQKQMAVNPLVEEGAKIIPSVTRVFSKSRDMYVYLQAYEQGLDTVQPLVASVAFYKGKTKALETPPISLAEATGTKLKVLPLQFRFGLSDLDPGEYLCQVSVLNPDGKKATFWQTPVMIIP